MGARLATASIARLLGGSLCGAAVLWWVACQAGWRDGEVIIHPVDRESLIRVDGRACPDPELPGGPIFVPASPGEHELTVHRDGRLLNRQSFRVEPGASLVVIAFDSPGRGPDPPRRGEPGRLSPRRPGR